MQVHELVQMDRLGDVAVLILSHPPVNALSTDLRASLTRALQAALAEPEVTAILLLGDGKNFSAGADIAEFGKPGPSRLGDLCSLIENAAKPVIAALHGAVLGGGLELALAAHYRIAQSQAQLGLPEVLLGLLPGAGATQRLPRLIGAADALRLILSGKSITAAEALALGLVDRVVDQDLDQAALAMAAEGLVPRRSCDMRRGFKDIAGFQAAIAEARRDHHDSPLPAPARIIDCVEASALLPFAQGLMAEEVAFADLMATPQAAGLRHAFFTERRAALPPPAVAARGSQALTRLGLWGADDMASDLAFQALSAGLHLVWAHVDRAELVQALERSAARQEQAVVAGTMTEAQRDEDWARLTTGLSADVLQGVDLVLLAGGATLPNPLAMPVAAVGAVAAGAETAGGPQAALTVPFAPGGLAELSMQRDAPPDLVARLVSLARGLRWRLVFAGPGGPIELHLRQALAAAVEDLVAGGRDAAAVAAAEAALGLGTGQPQGSAPAPLLAEVKAACLAAMAAEGARMVSDGRARRPLDVDAVALLAGLMPRWMGGPMFQADQRGLLVLRADLRRRSAPVYAPPQLMDDLISEGQNFASLNTR